LPAHALFGRSGGGHPRPLTTDLAQWADLCERAGTRLATGWRASSGISARHGQAAKTGSDDGGRRATTATGAR
ncbi:MAG: hypothetical protein J2P40_13145, partial [Candidatus Dormibacteraeota bacterium]|nr:hypothetical protein [Candidatus Dormibacteraeota bacterium]MBO0762214.1 hypothetical protein [Candidatus Dormibacteraeota bacterium]